jgi:quercetin dioxygenase-like cupin family protein
MKIVDIPFSLVEWTRVEATELAGLSGKAISRTRTFGDVRVRLVEYTPGYVADHWCQKGHILLCLEGRLETELADRRRFVLSPGASYQVADGAEPHRSSTPIGAKLFIVD